ncbi:MAG TPA: RNA polymerase sigma factor [Candidatus Methylacidiphilales bacterium]|jgi:RNA polymerase sigma-70 factor (ECF subfamily)|nr:RNA polymerase sigma factor [Candidatus Methylacidiphilales bacterium]
MHPPDFEEIVDRFYPMLYRFALSLARNEADASDLTQQTFSIWATKGHFLRDGSKAKSWLFTTLYREFISSRRREMRWQKEDLSEVENELPCAMPESVDHLESTHVMEALQSIDETFRTPLALFYLQEHSYEEIAQILEIPIGTVMSRLSRGKQKLQQAFLKREGPADTTLIRMPMRKEPGGRSHG